MKISNKKLQMKDTVRHRPLIHYGLNAYKFLFCEIKELFRPINVRLDFLLPIAVALFVLVVFEPGLHEALSFDGVKEKQFSQINDWRFLKGDRKPASKWTHSGFDDTTWRKEQGPFGYGVGGIKSNLTDMRGNYSRLYVRREFSANPAEVTRMNLSIVCDGAFIAYLNGIEVARSNKRITESIDFSGFAHELIPGKNVLAIECANNDIDGDSFVFMPDMEIN